MLSKFSIIFFGFLVTSVMLPPFLIVDGDSEIKGISASIALDRSTYPIPSELNNLEISIRIFDPDFDKSPNGIDQISEDLSDEPGVGPVKISIIRGHSVVLGYAGGTSSNNESLILNQLRLSHLKNLR